MIFAVLALIVFGIVTIVSAVEIPEVGSIDNKFCEGGVITNAYTFLTPSGGEALGRHIDCSVSNRTITKKAGPLVSRQVSECDIGCEISCGGPDFGVVNEEDCIDLAIAVLESDTIPDPILVAGENESPENIAAFAFQTCEMAFESFMPDFFASICKVHFATIGLNITEDCSSNVGFCQSGNQWEMLVLES